MWPDGHAAAPRLAGGEGATADDVELTMMIAQPQPTDPFLTADFPNAERRAAMRARHDAYVQALAETLVEAVEASVWQVRGARPGGRS